LMIKVRVHVPIPTVKCRFYQIKYVQRSASTVILAMENTMHGGSMAMGNDLLSAII
jgi:hypothetical protein